MKYISLSKPEDEVMELFLGDEKSISQNEVLMDETAENEVTSSYEQPLMKIRSQNSDIWKSSRLLTDEKAEHRKCMEKPEKISSSKCQ